MKWGTIKYEENTFMTILKAAISQTGFMLRKREAVCVFYVIFIMVIYNFVDNVLRFQGRDVLSMYHPMKMLLLSYNRTGYNASNTLMLIQVYPFLVALAAGFSLAKEYQLGIRTYMVSRIGNNAYQISKYIAVFFTTMIVFTVPFLLEIILNCLSFPMKAVGDMEGVPVYYSEEYAVCVNNYQMKNLYLFSPYLYAVVGTLVFGAISGLIGVFTVAVSSLVRVKYNVFLFIPVYVVLNSPAIYMGITGESLGGLDSINWYDYLLFFNEREKNVLFFISGISFLLIFLVFAGRTYARKDCL